MADISIKKYRGKRYIGDASPIVPAYIQGDAPPPNNPPGSTGGGKRDITALTEMLSTGLNEGGVLSINGGDASKFDISAGNGIIVDHSTSPPTFIEVSWNTFTAQTLTNLATSFATDIAINSLGQIVQQNSYTNEEVRGLIFLGGIDHNNQVTISDTFSITAPTKAVGSNVRELARAIGDINLTGNNYFANGVNLNINKSDGLVFSYGRNFLTNVDNPNTITTASETIVTFGYVFNDGSGNGVFTADTTTINTNNYDDGSGTLATVANNRFTIQRILLFANANKTFIQYGTEEYLKLDDALNAVPRATFVALNGIRTALIRGYLIVEKGETDLTNATFLSANRFGNVASNTVGEYSLWSDETTYIYRNGPVVIGTTTAPSPISTTLTINSTTGIGLQVNGGLRALGGTSTTSAISNHIIRNGTNPSGITQFFGTNGGSSRQHFAFYGAGDVEYISLGNGWVSSNVPTAYFRNPILMNGSAYKDASNIQIGTTTGTKFGTGTNQKISFWNKTPIVQPTNAITASAFVANTSGISDDTATYGGYTIGQISQALIDIGILQ